MKRAGHGIAQESTIGAMVELELTTVIVGLGLGAVARQLLSHSLESANLGRLSLAIVILTNTATWFFGAYLLAFVISGIFAS